MSRVVTATVGISIDQEGNPSIDLELGAHPDFPANIIKVLAAAGLRRAASDLEAMDESEWEVDEDEADEEATDGR